MIQLNGSLAEVYHAEITEQINAPASGLFIIRSTSFEFAEQLVRVIMMGSAPKIKLRLGLGGKLAPTWLPWQDHHITHIKQEPRGVGDMQSGHDVVITTADALWEMSQVQDTATHRGTISKIVERIAGQYGFTGKKAIIEPTVNEGFFVQSFEHDLPFILNHLRPRAINAKGRGNFRCYIKDGVFHFHTPDFHGDLRTFNFYGTHGQSVNLVQEDCTQVPAGASGVQMTTYDPYSGLATEVKSDPSRALRHATTMPPLHQDAPGLWLTYHLGTNPLTEAEAQAQNVYESFRANLYQLEMMVEKGLFLRVNDLLQLAVAPEAAKASVWSGIYSVLSVKQVYDAGALSSVFRIARGEQTAATGDFKMLRDLGVTVMDKNFLAPGQDLNLPEVTASEVIHGSGDPRVKPISDRQKS